MVRRSCNGQKSKKTCQKGMRSPWTHPRPSLSPPPRRPGEEGADLLCGEQEEVVGRSGLSRQDLQLLRPSGWLSRQGAGQGASSLIFIVESLLGSGVIT